MDQKACIPILNSLMLLNLALAPLAPTQCFCLEMSTPSMSSIKIKLLDSVAMERNLAGSTLHRVGLSLTKSQECTKRRRIAASLLRSSTRILAKWIWVTTVPIMNSRSDSKLTCEERKPKMVFFQMMKVEKENLFILRCLFCK